ncbi:hypothetical protein C2E21_8257 [Chlorella sorokiniana]|uniref:Uncharacterized protein n=1 Tax=Chlorella sorokiniana TaxID=3076 RepID=A0A2P6TF84_CHLSO|nr:hypothetical protein C2E21_8257 [Chlorella sorokiniana]|eukprot:PRW32628.1 hypothetical protein C2E21_8257 [Chlorella sorokiniana]
MKQQGYSVKYDAGSGRIEIKGKSDKKLEVFTRKQPSQLGRHLYMAGAALAFGCTFKFAGPVEAGAVKCALAFATMFIWPYVGESGLPSIKAEQESPASEASPQEQLERWLDSMYERGFQVRLDKRQGVIEVQGDGGKAGGSSLAWRLAASTLGQAAGQGAAVGMAAARAASASAAVVAPSAAARMLNRSNGSLFGGTAAFSSRAASALASPSAGTAARLSAPLRPCGLAAALAGPTQPGLLSRAGLPQLLQTAGLRQSACVGQPAKGRHPRFSGDAAHGEDGANNANAALQHIDSSKELPEAVQEEREFESWVDGLRQQGYHVHVDVQAVQQWEQGQPIRRAVNRTVRLAKKAQPSVDEHFLKRMSAWTAVLSTAGLFCYTVPAYVSMTVLGVLLTAALLAAH